MKYSDTGESFKAEAMNFCFKKNKNTVRKVSILSITVLTKCLKRKSAISVILRYCTAMLGGCFSKTMVEYFTSRCLTRTIITDNSCKLQCYQKSTWPNKVPEITKKSCYTALYKTYTQYKMCYQLKRLRRTLCGCVTRTRSQLKAVTRKRVSRHDRHRFQEKNSKCARGPENVGKPIVAHEVVKRKWTTTVTVL